MKYIENSILYIKNLYNKYIEINIENLGHRDFKIILKFICILNPI